MAELLRRSEIVDGVSVGWSLAVFRWERCVALRELIFYSNENSNCLLSMQKASKPSKRRKRLTDFQKTALGYNEGLYK